jgi:predicted nuclease with TOPRIM domain
LQLAKLQEEMRKKDSRLSAAQVRTRDRLKQLEQENAQFKNEVEKLKKEKLHTTHLVRFVVVVVVVVVEIRTCVSIMVANDM